MITKLNEWATLTRKGQEAVDLRSRYFGCCISIKSLYSDTPAAEKCKMIKPDAC